MGSKKINFIDCSLRDGHQSLLATRASTAQCLRVLPYLKESGYSVLELWGGATLDSALRFTGDDPFERLAAFDKITGKDIQIRSLCRGQNLFGYTPYPDNLVFEFIREAVRTGNRRIRTFDALNDNRNLNMAVMATKTFNGHAEAALSYTTSPVHDLAHFVKFAATAIDDGADSLAIKDMAGLLKPLAAYKLVKALKENVGIPIHLHTHDTSSNGSATLLKAAEAGVDIVDAALSSLSGLTAQPNLNALVATLEGSERDPLVNAPGLQKLANYWETVRDYYAPFESGLKSGTAEVYHHEIPGGQYSNYKPQVAGLGLIERWDECKEMYHKVNMMFGDIVKVTPSSKVVGDMSMFLVKNNLEPEDVFTSKEDLAFPESVVGMFKGMLGQPYQGWPEELQKIILKGEQPITCRPGELLEPVDFDEEKLKLEERLGHRIDDRALVSAILYPNVFPEFDRHRQQFSDTSVIPTPIFFYGLEPGQETSLDIEPGKTLIIKLNAVGKVQKDGTRAVYFELNGNNRSVVIRDQSVQSDEAVREKADKNNAAHIGAPMPGKVLKVNVKPGDTFKAGDVLIVTEAMKMETNIKAKTDGAVADVKFKEGEKVEKEDLVIVIAG